MKSKLVSVVVPVKKINNYILKEIIPALKKQTYQSFELIIVPDEVTPGFNLPGWVKIVYSGPQAGPADKRDLGVRHSKGEILAFIDDDAYPAENWLEVSLDVLNNNKEAAAVCGPGLTPPNDPLLAKVSGWVWSTWLGAGGAGTYRCQTEKCRTVDDYPTFNFVIRKDDFNNVGGFDSDYWPGEDTKLSKDLVFKLGKEIIYHPEVIVYHHRRKIFIPHLKQIARYGFQRGLFAKVLPETSNRLGYWIPSLFVLGLVFGPVVSALCWPLFYIYYGALLVYFLLLINAFIKVFFCSRNLLIAVLSIPTIFLTHLVYGLRFILGFLSKKY